MVSIILACSCGDDSGQSLRLWQPTSLPPPIPPMEMQLSERLNVKNKIIPAKIAK